MGDPRGTLLEIKNLNTVFQTNGGQVNAVENLNLRIFEAETLGVVGESGSGKSVTAYSILRIVPFPGFVKKGTICFRGEDLIEKSIHEMQLIRGNKISMVFQEPMTSLNPVLTVGRQVMEPLIYHQKLAKKEATREAAQLMSLVGITSPERRMNEYPHQFSGGMRQRVMIAAALACRPELLIADEPTTALDVTIQAQILALMKRLQREFGMAIMFITHDLRIVANMSDMVLVMYAGQGVEYAKVDAIFHDPAHPYTTALLQSRVDTKNYKKRLDAIGGSVPSPLAFPRGCRFHPRCMYAKSICRNESPPFFQIDFDHQARCWLLESHPRVDT